MRKKFALLALSLSLCVTFWVGVALGGEPAPAAVVVQDTFEFPPQLDGANVVHDFVIQNKGDAPLEITDVKAG